MATKRLLSLALALLLAISLPLSVAAQEYDLVNGDITVSADDSGQYVSQGDIQNELQTSDTVISSSSTTDNTITISTSDGAEADITIKDLDVSTNGETAIDVGSSNATIHVEGKNHIDSGTTTSDESLIHVSDGSLNLTSETGGKLELTNQESNGAVIGSDKDEEFSGSITVDGDIDLSAGASLGMGDGAAIGSGAGGDFTGDVTIAGEANVDAIAQDDGAGIGSGSKGEMSGSITIGSNADVTAISGNDGAGIGSGDKGEMSGSVEILDSAAVSAGSADEGAGIGSGYDGDMSETGTVTIRGDANVTAISGDDGAGIGSGSDANMAGTIEILDNAIVNAGSDDYGAGIGSGLRGEMSGDITIGGSAQVTASGDHESAGIGAGAWSDAGDGDGMTGTIMIRDNAQVTANAGREGSAAIGGEDDSDMKGIIAILGNAQVTTGVVNELKAEVKSDGSVSLTVTPKDNEVGNIGGQQNGHSDSNGRFIFSSGVTVNGVKGGDTDGLNDFVNLYQDGEGSNYINLEVSVDENGAFSAEVKDGTASVRNILYNRSLSVPTEPGHYLVECRIRITGVGIDPDEGPMTVRLKIGELIIPEKEPEKEPEENPPEEPKPEEPKPVGPTQPEKPAAQASSAALYRVSDQNGKDVPIHAEKSGTVYTITTAEGQATLTGNLYGLKVLRSWGVEELVFQAPEGTFTFLLDDLLSRGTDFQCYSLTHDGSAVSFTLDGESIADILK